MKIAKRICWIVIALLVVVVAINMIKATALDREIKKSKNNRYEKMLKVEGKYVLTQKTLEEEHKFFEEISKKESEQSLTIVIIFSATYLICIFGLIAGLLDFISKRYRYSKLKFIVGICLFSYLIIGNLLVPVFLFGRKNETENATSKYDGFYSFVEANIIDKKVVSVKTSNDDRKSEFYLFTNDNKKIKVDYMLYERVDEKGIYYLVQTEGGTILNIYPSSQFKLE